MCSAHPINVFLAGKRVLMSDVAQNYNRVIPIHASGLKQIMQEYVKNFDNITLQLVDPDSGVNYFMKPYMPPEGWQFYWATDIADNPLLNECCYDSDGSFRVVTKRTMKYPPHLQPVKK